MVVFASAPLSGLDAVAGQLQECEALSQVSTSVSIHPASISRQLRSLYSHQLRRHSPSAACHCLQIGKKKEEKIHLKQLFNGKFKTPSLLCEPCSRLNAAIEQQHRSQEPGSSVSLYSSRLTV